VADGGTGGGAGGTVSASSGTSGTGGEGGAAEPPTLDAFELVVIGSSTAAGEGASSDDRGWVSLLDDALEQASSAEITTVNLARGGYTTSELASGSNADGNIDDAIEREPHLIVVSLAGSNDLSAGTSESEFISRLSELGELATEAEIPVFFLSTAPKDLGTSEREELRDWAEAMGDEFGSCWAPGVTGNYSPCFVDIFEPLSNDNLGIDDQYGSGDGIHLNDAGHERIFEVTEPVIRAYVCSLTACP
jgi:lysophospholipase L1-like esterase